MRHSRVGGLIRAAGILVAVAFWPAALEAASADTPAQASIVVRTYTHAGSADALPTARRTVSILLGAAGIEVRWLECGLPGQASEASGECARPVRRNELVVRILPAGTTDQRARQTRLGFAFVDLNAGGGLLATVFTDRVDLLAQSAGFDAAELLGRAIAHEIGHLLLGTNRHAARGLMRASWSTIELRRGLETEWRFAGKEGDVMRRAIASRTGSGIEP
jgi:hypothetical protein